MTGLIVRYERDIAAHDDNPSRLKGEEYGVADEAAAAKYHPFAKIVSDSVGGPIDGQEGATAAGFPDWYVRRTEKAVEVGREILAYEAGEKAGEFDARQKVADEAAAKDAEEEAARQAANSGDSQPSSGDSQQDSGGNGSNPDTGSGTEVQPS